MDFRVDICNLIFYFSPFSLSLFPPQILDYIDSRNENDSMASKNFRNARWHRSNSQNSEKLEF